MTQPLLLQAISGTEAESLTVLAQRAQGWPLRALPEGEPAFGDDPAGPVIGQLGLRHLARGAPRPVEGEFLALRLSWSGAQLLLCLPLAGVETVLGAVGGELSLERLPAAWRQALDALVARWVRHLVGGLGRGQAQVMALERLRALEEAPALAHEFALEARFERTGAAAVGLLRVDSLGLLLLAGLAQDAAHAEPAPADAALRARLPCRLRLMVGETTLPVERLRQLVPGQALLVETRYLDGEQRLWVSAEGGAPQGRGFLARLEDFQLTVLQGRMDEQFPPHDDAGLTPEAEGGEPLPIEQLPVRLTFDLGETTVTFEALERLQAGQVIPTGRALQDYVAVRANGALVGRGVLMEVDGRLAVSLTALAPRAGG